MCASLVRTLSLVDGETPASYVSRLAAHHGTIPRELCSDLGMRWPWLCSGRPDQLTQLARLTGADLGRLTFSAPVKIGIGRYRIGGAISSVGSFRRTTIRICPLCACTALVQHGPSGLFQLLDWCVTCLHRCDAHGVALVALPSAAHSHETYDVVAQILRHHAILKTAADHPDLLPESAFETYIRSRIYHGPVGDWLDRLEIQQLHRACLTLGMTVSGARDRSWLNLDLARERQACDLGLSVLSQGPMSLQSALAVLRHNSTGARRFFSADLGHFYTWLRSVEDEAGVTDIIRVVQQHVFRHYPVHPDHEVLGAKPPDVIWIRFNEARKRTRLGVSFLKRLQAHLKGHSPDEAKNMTEITLHDLERIVDFWRGLCNLQDAAQRLGILAVQVKALIRMGVFEQIRFGTALRYVKRREIDELLSRLKKLPLKGRYDGSIPLRKFCALRRIALAKIVHSWVGGALDGSLCRGPAQGHGQGLQALCLAPDASCTKSAIRLDRDLSLAEAARYLRISVIAIRKLRDAGVLCQIMRHNADTNFRKAYISQQSLRAFEARFFTLGQLAIRREVAPIHLARRLDGLEVPMLETRMGAVRVYKIETLPGEILDVTANVVFAE